MDKISKALKKLNNKEKIALKIILLKIKQKNLDGLNIKKLKGYNNIFRARKGKLRIIFKTSNNDNISIIAIERKTDKTYNL